MLNGTFNETGDRNHGFVEPQLTQANKLILRMFQARRQQIPRLHSKLRSHGAKKSRRNMERTGRTGRCIRGSRIVSCIRGVSRRHGTECDAFFRTRYAVRVVVIVFVLSLSLSFCLCLCKFYIKYGIMYMRRILCSSSSVLSFVSKVTSATFACIIITWKATDRQSTYLQTLRPVCNYCCRFRLCHFP